MGITWIVQILFGSLILALALMVSSSMVVSLIKSQRIRMDKKTKRDSG